MFSRRGLLIAGVLVAGFWLGIRFFTPSIYEGVSFSREVYDREGKLLRLTLSGDEKYRIWTRLDDIQPKYVEAVLLLEDRYFHYHPGVNPWALARAAATLSDDDRRTGASTITMQLARIRYGMKTRTMRGKFWQILAALRLEIRHSKKEILEAYLNLAPFGGPLEGIGGASRVFFSKTPAELTLTESLLLAIVPQSPSHRNLSIGGKIENTSALSARNRLLEKWLSNHPEDRNRITDLNLPLAARKIQKLPFLAPHFTEMVLHQSMDMKIKTTLDYKLQRLVQNKMNAYVQSKKNLGVKNAAVLLLNSASREILAYAGSNDFFNADIQGQVDGILAKRSPGSALKPFVYALAFQQGLVHPKTLLKDTPLQFAIYDPENFDQKFLGPLSTEEALVQSRNIPAIWLSNQLRRPNFYEFLKNADVRLPRSSDYYGLSLVLGGTEVSMWEMARLYTMLANQGELDELIWNPSDKTSASKKLLSPESAFVTLDMLTKTPRPHENFRKDWVQSYYPVAWKTGTSHAFRDAWTVGVAGPYTLVVWLGNFDNAPNPALVGREMASPLFFQIIDGLADPSFKSPLWQNHAGLALKKVQVCKVSGHLPHSHCPHLGETWFQPGHSPISKCNIHRPVLIDIASGRRSCGAPSETNRLEVFEFWPSDLKKLFAKAGLQRRDPPPFHSSCDMQFTANKGMPPKITSPTQHVTYLKSLSSQEALNTLSLEAVADADARELYWFIDKSFIGKTKSQEALAHQIVVGDHTITVVDDLGRADYKKLSVRAVQ